MAEICLKAMKNIKVINPGWKDVKKNEIIPDTMLKF